VKPNIFIFSSSILTSPADSSHIQLKGSSPFRGVQADLGLRDSLLLIFGDNWYSSVVLKVGERTYIEEWRIPANLFVSLLGQNRTYKQK